jgi:hypothetical protein
MLLLMDKITYGALITATKIVKRMEEACILALMKPTSMHWNQPLEEYEHFNNKRNGKATIGF